MAKVSGTSKHAQQVAENQRLKESIVDMAAKIQYLIDAWPDALEDGGITFPDGSICQRTVVPFPTHGEDMENAPGSKPKKKKKGKKD